MYGVLKLGIPLDGSPQLSSPHSGWTFKSSMITSVHILPVHDVNIDATTCNSSKYEVDKRLLNKDTNIFLSGDPLWGWNLTVKCITVPLDVMKTYREVEVQIHWFLTLGLDRGAWSASCPGRLLHGETLSGTYWIGGLDGPHWTTGQEKNVFVKRLSQFVMFF